MMYLFERLSDFIVSAFSISIYLTVLVTLTFGVFLLFGGAFGPVIGLIAVIAFIRYVRR